MSETRSPQQSQGLARLLAIAGQSPALLWAAGILAFIHALLLLVPYLLVYRLILALLNNDISLELWGLIAWAAALTLLSYLLLYVSGLLSHMAAFNILYGLRRTMADKLGRLPLGWLTQQRSGAIKKILTDDIELVETFIAHQIPDFVKGVALPLTTVFLLFYLDWRLALVTFVPIPLLFALMTYSFTNQTMKAKSTEYSNTGEDVNAAIVEYVRAMPVMKIFGQSRDAYSQFYQSVQNFRNVVLAYHHGIVTKIFAVFMSFMSNVLLPILALGIWLYQRGEVTLPTLLLFLILGVGYIKPVFALSNIGSTLYRILEGVKRMDAVLNEPELLAPTQPVLPQSHSIRFNQVSFSYQPGQNTLQDVSFEVPQGTITALVGPSGAGKSTVAQLVCRFWDITSGSITLGGVDIRQIPLETLMNQVAFVFQDTFLFQESVRENIRMGLPATDAQVMAAAQSAQCHDLIQALPQGYDTRVGDVHFSGGEQQRIQLARAILKDAPVLILDEATAFADPDNEFKIQQAMSQLIRNKTVLVIAHRLSTITDSDQILVFDQGQIAARGTHPELLSQSPLYQQMWQAHTQAKTWGLREGINPHV